MTSPQVLAYYARHNAMTNPAEFAGLLDTLPADLTELHVALNDVLIHIWKIRRYHAHLLKERPHQVFIRPIRRVLANILELDSQPLNISRPIETRLIIDCRHFAIMLCAVLRQRGIPARARCGFATYLEKTHYQDHWVCEYWDASAGRWVMEDADLQLHDIPPDQFINGARAWQMCRADPSQANLFGFGPDIRGLWVVRSNLVRDFAALNGFESVSGDSWGLALKQDKNLVPDDLTLLDRAAALGVTDETFEERGVFYEQNEELRVPDIIHNYDYVIADGWRMVEWQKEM